MNYSGLAEPEAAPAKPPRTIATSAPAAVAAAPAASVEPSNVEFCRSVAMQDASDNGFDQPTQARVFARSYAQCVSIYTR